MIKGKRREVLNAEAIYSRISSYEIYRYYIGHDFKIGRPFNSPFREDSSPSFSVDQLNIGLHHIDYGDLRYRGSAIDFVMQYFSLTYGEALKRIDVDFGLGFTSGKQYNIRKAPVFKQPVIEEKKPPLIQVTTRKWNMDELRWWGNYFQGLDDLKAENIYVPKNIYRNREKLPLKSTDLVFCYLYPEIKAWKLYRPLKPKRGKNTPPSEWKWDSSCPFDYVEHLDKLAGVDIAYIAKSRKDKMVLQKALETDAICITTAEDPRCLTEENIKYIKENSQRQVTTSDNDQKGKQFSWYLTNEHGFLHCNVPDPLREKNGYTDFADWARGEKSLKVVRDHFTQKNLLNKLLKTA